MHNLNIRFIALDTHTHTLTYTYKYNVDMMLFLRDFQ